MNREKLERLAKALEAGDKINDVGFDFTTYRGWEEDCGTVGCIAGMALALEGSLENTEEDLIFLKARTALDLDLSQSIQLFTPDCVFGEESIIRPHEVTGKEAATAIRSLLNGNPYYWDHIIPESEGGLADG